MTQYALLDLTSGKRKILREGKNVIGRSAPTPAVDGVTFIILESSFPTVSRVQALVELAENGDAWLSDCNSTNGTYLSVNVGRGVRLEPNRFYQLRSGNRIVFGDREMMFDVGSCQPEDACAKGDDMQPSEASSLNTTFSAGLSEKQSEHLCASSDTRVSTTFRVTPVVGESSAKTRPQGNENGWWTSHESAGGGGSSHRSTSPQRLNEMVPTGKKRRRSNTDDTLQRTRKAVTGSHHVHWVCFSGMDGADRSRAQKLARKLGWQTTENIVDADLLVVGSPVARTPKFLIAVGRGIPIVTEMFFENGHVSELEKHVPALSHGDHRYSAASLRKVIFRNCKTPFLQGILFDLGGLSKKTRSVAREIILGCGGVVARGQAKGAVCLTEESLDGVYDKMLRGEPL